MNNFKSEILVSITVILAILITSSIFITLIIKDGIIYNNYAEHNCRIEKYDNGSSIIDCQVKLE